MDTLISNVTVVTMNERMEVLFGAYVGVEAGKIAFLGKSAPEQPPKTIVDGTGMVLMPGLVNCHTQLATTVLRSYCDDLSAGAALEEQLRREDKMDRRCAKAAALLGIAECLRFGVTSVSDLYYYPDATAEAASVCCDLAMLPIGGKYTMNAAEAAALANRIRPSVVVPIHYGSVAGSFEDFDRFAAAVDPEIRVCRLV